MHSVHRCFRSTQSLGVWRRASQAVEVTIERGHVLQRMGEQPCCSIVLKLLQQARVVEHLVIE